MIRFCIALFAALALSGPAFAISDFPARFVVEDINSNGTTIHVRYGGRGPAVLMIHGFGDTGDMWAPLAQEMVKSHRVIVPDLRGMGLSAHPDTGYTKKNEALDMMGVLAKLHIRKFDLVTHDIGNMVGYAIAAQFGTRVTKWVVMDAPLPGIQPMWDEQLVNPKTWHFNFRGPDEERLVAGRERIFLDRFYNELSANPFAIDEATRAHYAELYAQPHAMHDAFEQFGAFAQDGIDHNAFLAMGKLRMPVLAIGGDHSYGGSLADDLRVVALDVQSGVIANSGHWIMEEQPDQAVAMITKFLAER